MNAREMFKSLGYKRHESENGIQYFSESGVEITFIFMIRRFYKQENFKSLNISVDEFKAIQQQMKELGWIAKEEKQETNYEHFKDEIVQKVKYNLAVVNGEPKPCEDTNCDECDFKCSCCGEKRFEWLASPYKKPTYKLSKFEYDIIQTYRDCHESCKFSEFKQLIELKDKGYFQCVDDNTNIQDVLKNCEVIK